MSSSRFEFYPGEKVVYRMQKYTSHPGPRAVDVEPEAQGERYVYHVDKYWVVSDVTPDGSVIVLTRTGKRRRLESNDLKLRPARWWERLLLKSRFPVLNPDKSVTAHSPSN